MNETTTPTAPRNLDFNLSLGTFNVVHGADMSVFKTGLFLLLVWFGLKVTLEILGYFLAK